MSHIQHGITVDLASKPHQVSTTQTLYLDSDAMTWLEFGVLPPHEDPDSAGLAADWLDALAAEASKLADWYRSQARHARGACPPVCDGCRKCRCEVDAGMLVTGGTWTMCQECAVF